MVKFDPEQIERTTRAEGCVSCRNGGKTGCERAAGTPTRKRGTTAYGRYVARILQRTRRECWPYLLTTSRGPYHRHH